MSTAVSGAFGRACAILAAAASLAGCSTVAATTPPASGVPAQRAPALIYASSADLPRRGEPHVDEPYVYLLHVDNVKGTSTYPGYADWIDASAFSLQAPAGRKTDAKTLTVTVDASRASPVLADLVFRGMPAGRARLEVLTYEKGKLNLFMDVELRSPVTVLSFQSSSVGAIPDDTFAFEAPSGTACVGTTCTSW